MKYATAIRDGFNVPLIGIPESATLETCDCCGETIGLSQSTFTGTQVLCGKCKEPDETKPTDTMKTILIAAFALLTINLHAADSKAVKWIDSITVAPVAVIQTEGIDGASTFGAGADLGVGINKYVSVHVAGYGYETDSWGGGAVDELESYVKANLASFSKQVVVVTAKAGAVWDTALDDYAMSVGAGLDLNVSKRFALGADYSIRAWFNEREKDSLLRFFGQVKF